MLFPERGPMSDDLKIEDLVSPESFSHMLKRLQQEKKKSDPSMIIEECASQAKISDKSWKYYLSGKRHPSHNTVMLIAFVLELNWEETEALLHSAGYHYEQSNMTDIIVRSCIELQVYNLDLLDDLFTLFQEPKRENRNGKGKTVPIDQLLVIAQEISQRIDTETKK